MDLERIIIKSWQAQLGTALFLYHKCLTEVNRGVLPCSISVDEYLDSKMDLIMINCIVDQLMKAGYNAYVGNKKETMCDDYHNHTYEVKKLYIVIESSRGCTSKL